MRFHIRGFNNCGSCRTLVFAPKKQSVYNWTHAGQTPLVQGSTVFLALNSSFSDICIDNSSFLVVSASKLNLLLCFLLLAFLCPYVLLISLVSSIQFYV